MSPLRIVLSSLLAAAGLYAGYQVLRVGFDGQFRSYVNPSSLGEARALGTFLGSYRASCREGVPAPGMTYAVRPLRKALGPLLVGTREIIPEAVAIIVDQTGRVGNSALNVWRESNGSALYLNFSDGAGVSIEPDGTTVPIPRTEGDIYGPDRVVCCYSNRSRVPERFWLTDGDGARLCEFTFDEATRRDVPPQTRWTW